MQIVANKNSERRRNVCIIQNVVIASVVLMTWLFESTECVL